MEGAGPKCDGQKGSWAGSGKGWKHLLCLRRDHAGEGDRGWKGLGRSVMGNRGVGLGAARGGSIFYACGVTTPVRATGNGRGWEGVARSRQEIVGGDRRGKSRWKGQHNCIPVFLISCRCFLYPAGRLNLCFRPPPSPVVFRAPSLCRSLREATWGNSFGRPSSGLCQP